MSLGTILSRITGFVRTWSMAVALGVSVTGAGNIPIASAYTIANNIPNMIYELVAGGVLSSMFIPVFMERMRRDGEAAAHKTTNTLFSLMFVVLGVVALVGTLLPEVFVWTQTFTKSAGETRVAVELFRFFAVQIIFYGFVALTTGVLNSYRRFFAPAIAPLFNNVVVIVVLLGFYLPLHVAHPDLAIAALGIGTTLGVVALFATQVPALMRIGFRFRWSMDLADPSLRTMVRKAGWLVLYVAVNLVGISFRNAFATSALPDGAAALQYAWMWYQLPYGVLAVSYLSAVFPELSHTADRKDWTAFKGYFSAGLRSLSLLMLPSIALLLALGTPLVSLYRFGSFSADAIPLVTASLAGWTIGLFFFAAYMLVLRAFYAMQDTRTPALTNLVLTFVQVGLYWALPLAVGSAFHGAFAGFALVGIPLADTVFFGLHLTVLLVILRRRIGGFGFMGVLGGWARSLAGAVAAGLVAWGVVFATSGLGAGTGANVIRIVLGATGGIAAAYFALRATGMKETDYVDGLIRRAFGRLTGRSAG
jgi:putative peptidoglycan lipid II flippase